MDSFLKEEGRDGALQVIPRISPRRLYILSHISPESQYHIDNNRGTHRQQGCVDKILADAARCNAHAVANSGTNTKGIPFNKVFEFVHTANLKNLCQRERLNPEKDCFCRKFATLKKMCGLANL